MSRLEKLSIYYKSDDIYHSHFTPQIMFRPFTFTQLPILKSLDINFWCLAELFTAANGAFPTVLSIRIDYSPCKFVNYHEYLNYFEQCSKIFPQLKILTLKSAMEEVSEKVFTHMQYLEELELQYSFRSQPVNINNILCGFQWAVIGLAQN